MKVLNPFNTPGSPQAEQRRIRRERFRFVVWTIVVANVLLLIGLLIQGCQREPVDGGTSGGNAAGGASSETIGAAMGQPILDTNAPIAPTFQPPVTNSAAEPVVTNAPANPIVGSTRQYVVVKGDSFYKIAKANGITVKALTDANPGVDSAKLKVGQKLQIPGGTKHSATGPVRSPKHAGATVSASSGRYVVKTGDTLVRIARTHGTTVKAIKMANGLTSDRITVGRSLKIPQPKLARASAVQV